MWDFFSNLFSSPEPLHSEYSDNSYTPVFSEYNYSPDMGGVDLPRAPAQEPQQLGVTYNPVEAQVAQIGPTTEWGAPSTEGLVDIAQTLGERPRGPELPPGVQIIEVGDNQRMLYDGNSGNMTMLPPLAQPKPAPAELDWWEKALLMGGMGSRDPNTGEYRSDGSLAQAARLGAGALQAWVQYEQYKRAKEAAELEKRNAKYFRDRQRVQQARDDAIASEITNSFQAPGGIMDVVRSMRPAQSGSQSALELACGGKVPSYANGGVHMNSGQGDRVPALLSPGEYVWDADVVAALGDGNTDAGAAMLDDMRENIREYKRSADPSEIPPPTGDPLRFLPRGALSQVR